MPSSRHVRTMRRAISPRLAIRIFWNTYARADDQTGSLSGLASAASGPPRPPPGPPLVNSRGPWRAPGGAVGVGRAPEHEAPLRLPPREGQGAHAFAGPGPPRAAADAGGARP